MKNKQLYFSLGRPFSPLYSLIMRFREHLYARGTFKTYSMGVPVISVGNLTLGGTGKTPLVQYIARSLQKNGFSPAVISRGYSGKAKEKVNIVSNGSTILMDAVSAGDETRFLAETLPGVPVLTGIVRTLPAKRAVELGADVLVLDDGFQHMRIQRQVNLVLFNSDILAGNSRVFPGGDLREPVAALNRATGFVMTGVREDNKARAEKFLDLLNTRVPNKEHYLAGYAPTRFTQLDGTGLLSQCQADVVKGKRVFGFCGIAHPESFIKTLDQQDINRVGFQALPDHTSYSPSLVEKLQVKAAQSGADLLVTTEKDLVKFNGVSSEVPIVAVGMDVTVNGGFDKMLIRAAEG